MGDMKIAWFALAVIALVLLAVLGRYEIVPTSRSDGDTVLKLDRWTGQTRAFGGGYWTIPIREDAPQ